MKVIEKKTYVIGGVLLIILVSLAILINRPKSESFRNFDEIIHNGKLRVVSENSITGILINNDSISGFQYEILKTFADSLGVELEILIINDFEKCITELNQGKFDIIARFIPTTTEWVDTILFSKPLVTSRQMLVQKIPEGKKDGKIHTQYQLANDSIYISSNSPHKKRLEHLSNEIADTIHIIELNDLTSEQLVALVAEGKIRNTICHEQLSRKLIKTYSNIDISVPISMSQPYSWIVHKNSTELLEKLNEFLSEFIGSNDYWNLYRKYY